MNDADVAKIVVKFATRGRSLAKWQAAVFLEATELLKANPTNEIAAEVISTYSAYLAVGTPIAGFAEFMVAIPPTAEESAAQAAWREAHPTWQD